MRMQDQAVIETQLEFYRKGKAGCLFLAHAAGNPAEYDWRLSVCTPESEEIEKLVQSAVALPKVSTQSIIFPSVMEADDLIHLFRVLRGMPSFSLGQKKRFKGECLSRVPPANRRADLVGYRLRQFQLSAQDSSSGVH